MYKNSKVTFHFDNLNLPDEYLERVLKILESHGELTPRELSELTGLTLNATNRAVKKLESRANVIIKRSDQTPTILVDIRR